MYTIQQLFGFIAFMTSLIGLLPQVYKAYITKSTQDVSLSMLINYLIGSMSWIIYGIYEGALFVTFSNIAGSFVSIISIVQKKIYDKKCS